jgi:hypothetical protein
MAAELNWFAIQPGRVFHRAQLETIQNYKSHLNEGFSILKIISTVGTQRKMGTKYMFD